MWDTQALQMYFKKSDPVSDIYIYVNETHSILTESGLSIESKYLNISEPKQPCCKKKECGPQKGEGEKRCEIQGGAKKWL